MKLWPVVAVATVCSSLVWACKSEPADSDGEGGQGGEGTGGSPASGGSGTGGSAGSVSCEPEQGSESWGGAGGAGGAENVDIFGDWSSQFGNYTSYYSFDEETIDTGYAIYDVVGISDAGQYVVARNPEGDTYYPCLFSRFDWTLDGEDLYLCRRVLDAESVEAAVEGPASDRDDLETGCNGFPWSQLTAE